MAVRFSSAAPRQESASWRCAAARPRHVEHARGPSHLSGIMPSTQLHARYAHVPATRRPLRSSSVCGLRIALVPSQAGVAACGASTLPAFLARHPLVAARLSLQPRPLSLALPSHRACVGLASCPPQHGLRNAPCRVAPVCKVTPPQPAPRRARWLAPLRAARPASSRRVRVVQVRAAQLLPFPVCRCSHTSWPRCPPALHLGRPSPCGYCAWTERGRSTSL